MFENLCTLPLTDDVLALALHPSEPFLIVGLSSGHAECFRLPSKLRSGLSNDDSDGDTESSGSIRSDGKDMIRSIWRTRRHKGGCRCLAYSYDSQGRMPSTLSVNAFFD